MIEDINSWLRLSIPYNGDFKSNIAIENYLREKVGKNNFEIRVEKDWPNGKRTRYSYKVITKHFYYIRNSKDFTLFALKFG